MRTELELQSDSICQNRQPAQPCQENNQQPLTCPRCESTNTKFCYYNNYNLSQPRHYCKSCRRYWTQGGTLRNIPVGGGTRKNNPKRSRTINIATTSSSSTSSPIPANPVSSTRPVPVPISSASLSDFDLNGLINVSGGGNGYGSGSFFNPLNSGFLALNGFGSGYDNMGGFEIGKAVWPLGEVSETAGAGNAISGGGGDGNTWQFGIGSDGGFGETECLTNWTELAMATASRKSVK